MKLTMDIIPQTIKGNIMISRGEVLKLLNYDKFSGVFTWKVARPNAKIGAEAGWVMVNVSGKPYRFIQVSGRTYCAHRLAWLVLTGEFPKHEIDHINGQGLDNRSVNLREVTRAENCKNQRKPVNNTSGHTGVYWRKDSAKWQVGICLNGKPKHLGFFDDFADAVAVRKEAERTHGFHENHGSERNL